MRGNAFHRDGDQSIATLRDDIAAPEASCFADDVIIDFPSVAPAVDRIRTAFVDHERPTPLSTAIQVSAREAREGAVVPLEVPLRRTCRVCGGRGGSWTEQCVRCEGSGCELLPHRLQVKVPAGVIDGTCLHFTVAAAHNPPTRIELRIVVA